MVDAAETFGECNDTEKGFTPNHAVVVLGIDEKDVLFYDPEWEENRRLSHRDFTEAWNDSSGFMVIVGEIDILHKVARVEDLEKEFVSLLTILAHQCGQVLH